MPDRERKGVLDHRFSVLKGSLPLAPSAHPGTTRSGLGIVHENFHGSETDCREKNCPQGKETGGTRKIGRTGFSSAPNTHETYEAHSNVAIAHLGRVIVNTITCCCCHGLATGLTQSFLHASALCFSFLKKQMLQKFWKQIFRGGGGGGWISEFFFWINSHPCLQDPTTCPEVRLFGGIAHHMVFLC